MGAVLADMPPGELGVRSAVLTVPLLGLDLAVFWALCRRIKLPIAPLERIDDVAWVASLAAALYVANRTLPVEVAGLASTAGLLMLRFLRDHAGEGIRQGQLRKQSIRLEAVAPFAGLSIALLTTRLVTPLATLMTDLWTVSPLEGWPAFAPFQHVSAWLILVAAITLVARGHAGRWRALVLTAGRAARLPAAVTLLFTVIAQWMVASSMTASLAGAWSQVAGVWAPVAGPLFAAVTGFLTGSVVATHGLIMPLQTALAGHTRFDPYWMAAIQNTAGSALSMLSPVRVAMVCAIAGASGEEGEVYARMAPLGVSTALFLAAVAAVLSGFA